MKSTLISLTAMGCVLLLARGTSAQCETAKIEAPTWALPGNMGQDVTVSGDHALISSGEGMFAPSGGAPFKDGELFAIHRDPQYPTIWSDPAPVPNALLNFQLSGDLSELGLGHAIDIDGDWAIIGSRYTGVYGQEGMVGFLKYEGGAWTENIYIFGHELDLLSGHPPGTALGFGYSVAISDRWAIVGAPTSGHVGPTNGAAYLFERTGDTWSFFNLNLPPTSWGLASAEFGKSVDIFFDPTADRGMFAIGGPGAQDPSSGTNPGKAYVKTWPSALIGWSSPQTIGSGSFPPDYDPPFIADYFGTSVAVSDSYVIVGSPGWEPGSTFTDVGRAYVFQRTPSDVVQKHQVVTQSLPVADDDFGRSVSMDDDLAVVGGSRFSAAAPGFATVFQRTGSTPATTVWIRKESYAASDVSAPSTNHFGFNIAIDDQTIFVGAPQDPSSVEEGAAYVYTREKLPLCAVPQTVSQANGGNQIFTIDAGTAFAGKTYVLAGSTSGYTPGTQWGSVLIPVNYNWLTAQGINNPNQPPYTSNLGTLDALGRASAMISIPPGIMDPGLVGTTIYHAYVVLGPGFNPVFASNPVPLRVNP